MGRQDASPVAVSESQPMAYTGKQTVYLGFGQPPPAYLRAKVLKSTRP